MSRTTVTRLREKAVADRAELDRLLDDTFLAHIGMTGDHGGVVVIPTGIARDTDHVLVHGSTGSGWMRRAASGVPVCVTVTQLNGIVVARSSFESSFHYRSAVLFGTFSRLTGTEAESALDVLTERFIPGRAAEIRRPHRRELAATMVLSMPIREWSVKLSDGWPDDEAEDIEGSAWAGVVPFGGERLGEPRPAPDLRPGIPVPESVRTLMCRAGIQRPLKRLRENSILMAPMVPSARSNRTDCLGGRHRWRHRCARGGLRERRWCLICGVATYREALLARWKTTGK
ncbi:MAG: pyridoxamine 5'-phosphate oxidase family protein [Streptosporangiaceae bacterium]|nr:pyridoxamine 5'-phosphate oxidase family protein [Streptosporangiaceae bacterium]